MIEEFEPITDPIMVRPSRKGRHVLIVRGQSKNRPHSGDQGRAGRRKARGYRKGFGYGGSRPTPPKAFGRKADKA